MHSPPTHNPQEESVVLVDDDGREIGTLPKSEVHTAHTPLHRAFSVFLFDGEGRLLLQQRGRLKKTWPLMWSNSCCGHPLPGERTEDAIRRRVRHELGITQIAALREAVPDFRYRAEKDGVVENEICPVWVGTIAGTVALNPDEVEAMRWADWPAFVAETKQFPECYSPWCVWETDLLGQKIDSKEWESYG